MDISKPGQRWEPAQGPRHSSHPPARPAPALAHLGSSRGWPRTLARPSRGQGSGHLKQRRISASEGQGRQASSDGCVPGPDQDSRARAPPLGTHRRAGSGFSFSRMFSLLDQLSALPETGHDFVLISAGGGTETRGTHSCLGGPVRGGGPSPLQALSRSSLPNTRPQPCTDPVWNCRRKMTSRVAERYFLW